MKVFLTQLHPFHDKLEKNLAQLTRLLEAGALKMSPHDILLLPELFGAESSKTEYHAAISMLARKHRIHVVGGSHHEKQGRRILNCGYVANAAGEIISRYEKLRPYGIESQLGVSPGKSTAQFDLDGCRVLILICADFWYSEVFLSRLSPRPDLILVPTFSISSRPAPAAARSLWRSMAVSRAYEFAVYVGISDWAYPSQYHQLRSSSVAGLADPRPLRRDGFFSKLGRNPIAGFEIDLSRLKDLRQHRARHAFLSDETLMGRR
jgi:omega-amidase